MGLTMVQPQAITRARIDRACVYSDVFNKFSDPGRHVALGSDDRLRLASGLDFVHEVGQDGKSIDDARCSRPASKTHSTQVPAGRGPGRPEDRGGSSPARHSPR